jgi:hypothetical protein
MSPKSLLLQAVRDKARLRRLGPRTVRAYVGWIRRFIRFHGRRHPRELSDGAVTSFLNHLVLGSRCRSSRGADMECSCRGSGGRAHWGRQYK